jgi:hypothetical protein
MRIRPATTLLAVAFTLVVFPDWSSAQPGEVIETAMIPEPRRASSKARLRTAIDPADPDTVWIGHIYDPGFTAGGTMQAGGYGPYHVGRGPNRPTKSGGTIGANGTWDFDRFQPGETDSLFGWWPLARCYQSGATTRPDYQRAFFALDFGNQVNYVINQGSPKRTFGVVGLWHRDRGNIVYAASDTVEDKDPIAGGTQDNITNVQPVLWSPTEVGGAGSTASAWMGMRSHGDLSHRDLVSNGGTGNCFNDDLLQYQGNNGFNAIGSISVNGTDHNFPGYGSQMDQMLYRDIPLAEDDGLVISFNFSTNMSTAKNTTTGVRAGWFDKDPLSNAMIGTGTAAPPSNDGNFISSDAAGANAPCDSFMVYVGAPVDDENVTFSAPLVVHGNTITSVYDRKRRWFSEVLKLNGPCLTGSPCSIIGKEIASYAGVRPPTSVTCNVGALYPTQLQAIKDADGVTGNGGVARLVFRVKTNRGFDDENNGNPSAAFDSGTRGAAIVDNVVVNGWAASNGDFEAEDAINNDLAVPTTAAWKSTGKPPSLDFHVHSVMPGNGLAYDDPCGSLDNPNRQCNLYGNVLSAGNHDEDEKEGGVFGSNTQDRARWIASPTINLSSTGNGPGSYNAMGVDDEVARTSSDYEVYFSIYDAGLAFGSTQTGNFPTPMGWQSYPARQPNGNITWGETRAGNIQQYGSPLCFQTVGIGGGAKFSGKIRTTNPENRPDSLRVYVHVISRCYSFTALSAANCTPTTGPNVGTYFDNISVALVDAPPVPALSVSIWNLIGDAFPANGNSALIPAGFDTTAAHIRTPFNLTFVSGSGRPSVTADSTTVVALGANHRVDLVFRILPGPGNYMTIGSRASGVSRRPDGKPSGYVAATPGDGSFFGEYMANAGEFASAPSHPGGQWSAQIWNSARMDTAEINLFPTANNGNVINLIPGIWAGMYHEVDPKFGTLGILKNRCVMIVPTGATNSTNIICDGTGWAAYGAGSGWDGSVTTREYTKILPDGLLTPGSHVQYFFRKSDLSSPTAFDMMPDTNFILQPGERSTDGHRWQQFGVLPDRWKDAAWSEADRHADAPACMLYVDWCDGRGDERIWVGIADSIGATAASRYGAHNGWHARGDQDPSQSLETVIGTADDWGVYPHGGQPGTTWDMFGIRAAETGATVSSFGSRLAAPTTGYMAGKETKTGPTGDMLRHYYRILFALTGDLGIFGGPIGPFSNKTDDDIGLLQDFATGATGTARPRLVWFQGSSFMAGQIGPAQAAHPTFPPAFFGTGLASGSYRGYAANTHDVIELVPNAPLVTSGDRFGLPNTCRQDHDVLTLTGTFGSIMAAKYPDTGTGANPKIASVYAPSSLPGTDHPMVTLVDGFRISSLGSWQTLTTPGRIGYFHQVLSNLSAALNCPVTNGPPVGVGEGPHRVPLDFLALGSENPMRAGAARITFGIARQERVELRIYDVAGRTVRTLAHRVFPAGEHELAWDGRDDDGRQMAKGVYFYQMRTSSFVGQKKITLLRN